MNKLSTRFLYHPLKSFKYSLKNSRRRLLLPAAGLLLALLPILLYSTFVKPPSASADSLIKFDEGYGTTVNDSAGSVTGTINGPDWKTEDLCKSEKCLYFNGTSDYVEIEDTDDSLDASGDYTLMAWIRLTSDPTDFVNVITKGDSNASYNYYMDINASEQITTGYSGEPSAISSDTSLDINRWYHIVVVHDDSANMAYIYINGEATSTSGSYGATSPSVNNGSLDIGAFESSTDNYGEFFPGFIDEVKIYPSTALSSDQIKTEYLGSTPDRGTSASFGGGDQSYLSDGLVGYWKMDETSGNATDYSGNGTTLTNNSTTPFTSAKFGNGSEHDGSTDYFEAADNATLSLTGDLTLSAWINNDDTTGSQDIIGKWDGTNNSYMLALEGDELRMYIDSSSNHQTTTAANIGSNTFTHVAGAYSATSQTVKLFVNGIEQASTTTGGTIPSSIGDDAGEIVIGADDSPANYFDGHIDDARIYNRALSPTEVAKLYKWAPGPVAYYDFNENTGTTSVYDKSGNGNTGTMNGSMTATDWVPGKFGSALDFDHTDDYISVSDSDELSVTGNLTISSWIYPHATTASTHFNITAKWDDTNTSYLLAQYGDEIRMYIGSASNYETTDSSNLTANTWYHVTGAYNAANQTVTLYIDGVEQASTTTGTIPASIGDHANSVNISAATASGGSTYIDRYVNASSDDAKITDAEYEDDLWAPLFGGVGTTPLTNHGMGFRFTNITIPNGATVTSAYLTLMDAGDGWIDVHTRLTAIDEDNTATFSSGSPPGSRPITSSYIADDAPNIDWVQGVYYDFPSNSTDQDTLGDAINAVVNRSGWDSGNALGIVNNSDQDSGAYLTYGREEFVAYDYGPGTYPPAIHIDYELPDLPLSAFDGLIDEVRVYNYVRTQEQVVSDMNAGHPAPGSPVGSASSYWKFDEGYSTTAYDTNTSTGGAENLTLSTATSSWSNDGKFGKAFSGGGARWLTRIDDDDLDFTATEDVTISLWVDSTIATGGNPPATEYIINKPPSGATNGGYAVYANTSGQVCFGIDDDNSSFPEDSVCTNTDVYDNTWHNIVAVKSGTSRLDMYLDGQPNGTPDTSISSVTNTLANSSTFFVASQNAVDDTDDFNGNLDEMKIYRLAMTADQVKVEYNQGKAAVWGASGTDSSGNATWSSTNEYCPPGQGSTCTPPVAHWKLDENTGSSIYDSSGNSYNSVAAANSWVNGIHGSAARFNGSNQAISFGDVLDVDGSTSFTISFWLKPLSSSSEQALITKQNYAYNDTGYGVRLWGTSIDGDVCLYVDSGAATYDACTSDDAYTVGQWQHITAVFDRTESTINERSGVYINGVRDFDTSNSGATAPSSVGDASNAVSLAIATVYNGGSGGLFLNGQIDDARFYNYARTPAQIAWDYNRGGPVGWWKFDESSWTNNCSTDTVFDNSGRENDGVSCPNGTGQSTPVTGVFNTAIDLDGSEDYVEIDDAVAFSFGDGSSTDKPFSLSAWVNMDDATFFTVVQKITNSGSVAAEWALFTDDSDKLFLELYDNGFDNYINQYTSEPLTSYEDTWVHLVGTYDGSGSASGISLYINGMLQLSIDGSFGSYQAMHNLASDIHIGAYLETGSQVYADGAIDDVRIYNYEMTPQQIKDIYNQGAVSIQ